MDHQPPRIDFALIGHQDSWQKTGALVNRMRLDEGMPRLSLSQVMEIYPYIPPRPLFELNVVSARGRTVKGVYIDTFIPPVSPDPSGQSKQPGSSHVFSHLQKVKEACDSAASLGAPIVALGGLTSILLEANAASFQQIGNSTFTTGNTLTAAFIVRGVESACRQLAQPLSKARLLIIGSTGDIGSACVRYFSGKVSTILLHARQPGPLRTQALALLANGQPAIYSTRLEDLLPTADKVISAASSSVRLPSFCLLPKHAIVCDAGYPKNLDRDFTGGAWLFSGGLGQVTHGFTTDPAYYKDLYDWHLPKLAHGCLLEAVVLAMEKQPVAFSSGRGNITVDAMENILQLADRHGIRPAPINTNHYEQHSERTGSIIQADLYP